VSLKGVLREGIHDFAWFLGNPCPFYISSTISLLDLYCDEFPKSFIKLFLRNVFKSFFKFHDDKISYIACVYLLA
jgi:hypothetical protein